MKCATPTPSEMLVAYWAGELDAEAESSLEEHVFGCDDCAAASARVASVTETLRGMIPPIVTRGTVDRLRAKGQRIREYTFAPGVRNEAGFSADVDLLVFRLGDIDLSTAGRVAFEIRAAETGHVIDTIPDVPFERDEKAVLLLCQRHYAVFPALVDVEIRVRDARGDERVARYTIFHRFEAPDP